MTREEALFYIKELQNTYASMDKKVAEAVDMAIEALSQPIVAKHFDIQSGYIYCSPEIAENVKVVVRCKDCRHQEHCHETVAHTKEHDGFREHWSETIEWCSRGERKGGDTE